MSIRCSHIKNRMFTHRLLKRQYTVYVLVTEQRPNIYFFGAELHVYCQATKPLIKRCSLKTELRMTTNIPMLLYKSRLATSVGLQNYNQHAD